MNIITEHINKINKTMKLVESDCKDNFEIVNNFKIDVGMLLGKITKNIDIKEAKESLVMHRCLQSVLFLNDIIYLLYTSQYISAVQLLRYFLESILQSYYLDHNYPNFKLENKICILTEINDKRDYYISNLLNKLKLDNKDEVRSLYKKLSSLSHPSHIDFPNVNDMLKYIEEDQVIYDCNKIKEIISHLIKTYDLIFYTVLLTMEKRNKEIKDDENIKTLIKKYQLVFIKKI